MPLPIRHLPVVQNWDCHVTGTCCKEYVVTVTDEERRRIEAQGWDPAADLEGRSPFRRRGLPWARHTVLNHRPDGGCVFLSAEGRCRIHERHGYQAKPLACRLFPFVLVPQGDRWGVSLRYACPSAAGNRGRALPEHDPDLRVFAEELARRENLHPQADGMVNVPPRIQGMLRLDWPDLRRLVEGLLVVLRNRREPMERRWRKVLTLTDHLRAARLDRVAGPRLDELIEILTGLADSETPASPLALPPPGWVGRVLFRQAAALYTRKDHGPNRGLASQGRVALMRSALRFARGSGPVPRMHGLLPEATFEELEKPTGPLPPAADEVLERYYTLKVGSLQFCGAASFGLAFWEGLEGLAATFPVILWVSRMYRDQARERAIERALTIVDDHFGFNRVLATLRQRLNFTILHRTGELARLIAWYSR